MVGPTAIGGRTSMPARNRRTSRRWPQRSAPVTQPGIACCGPWPSFLRPSHGFEICGRCIRWRAWKLEPEPACGYKVVFVPFRDGRPAGDPIDFATGFLTKDGKARGRPVGVTLDPRGALIVADGVADHGHQRRCPLTGGNSTRCADWCNPACMLNDRRYLGVSLFDAGGMARDVLLAEIPIVLRAELYAVAALAAATDAI